jgi:hypothetical protein
VQLHEAGSVGYLHVEGVGRGWLLQIAACGLMGWLQGTQAQGAWAGGAPTATCCAAAGGLQLQEGGVG